MCGICGSVAFRGDFDTDETTVVAMRDTLAHRGPDDAGAWVAPDGSVALGHRRLSIVDLSPAGHQPMCNEDGSIWITYNGEIYNHATLRGDLERRGHRYRSHTDTETILHLYEEHGHRCVEWLHGMFAFAIWDANRRELLLARDRLGIKPLYYAFASGGFVFGSEIKSLLRHPAVHADLDEEAFLHYLTFISTPAPATMFAGISKLAPAETMVLRRDGSALRERYWQPLSADRVAEVARLTEREVEERLIDLLRQSIAKRMMSDVPFGVFLSGGVDSSTNVALMSELMDDPVRTFSVGFSGHDRYNELDHARAIARRFGTDHREVVIDWEDLESFVPQLIHSQDEPIADWVCVPLHFVSKLARDSDTIVVQVGEGSDELFHGYDSYIAFARMLRRYWQPAQRIPRPLRRLAAASVSTLTARRGERYGRVAREIAAGRVLFWGGAISYQGALKRSVVADGVAIPDSYEVVDRLWREAGELLPGADVYQRMTYLELKQRLAELLLMRVDKMTMANSVEARVPFLDHELVEFALAMPGSMKVRGGVGKYALKRAVEPILPRETVYRKKQGFGAPVPEWFRGELGRRVQRQIAGSSLAERGLLDYGQIDALWDEHRAGVADRSVQLWNVYNASAWHDYWIAQRALA